jgi:hypothetical protein
MLAAIRDSHCHVFLFDATDEDSYQSMMTIYHTISTTTSAESHTTNKICIAMKADLLVKTTLGAAAVLPSDASNFIIPRAELWCAANNILFTKLSHLDDQAIMYLRNTICN